MFDVALSVYMYRYLSYSVRVKSYFYPFLVFSLAPACELLRGLEAGSSSGVRSFSSSLRTRAYCWSEARLVNACGELWSGHRRRGAHHAWTDIGPSRTFGRAGVSAATRAPPPHLAVRLGGGVAEQLRVCATLRFWSVRSTSRPRCRAFPLIDVDVCSGHTAHDSRACDTKRRS